MIANVCTSPHLFLYCLVLSFQLYDGASLGLSLGLRAKDQLREIKAVSFLSFFLNQLLPNAISDSIVLMEKKKKSSTLAQINQMLKAHLRRLSMISWCSLIPVNINCPLSTISLTLFTAASSSFTLCGFLVVVHTCYIFLLLFLPSIKQQKWWKG